jgi:hypothetical protein
MIRKLLLIGLLLMLAACASPAVEQDGGIGGTGAPAAVEMLV